MAICKKSTHWIAVGLISCLMAACAAWGLRNAPPEIKLAAIRPMEMRGLENQFEVDLRILNQGDQPMSIHGIQCDLILNDRNFANGVGNPEKQIPAYASDTVTLTVFSSLLDMARLFHGLIKNQENHMGRRWTYAVRGHLQIEYGGSMGKLPFDTAGEIDLDQLMGAGK